MSTQYEPPYNEEEMRKHGYSEEIIEKLKHDPVHGWRMKTGIELIHREPTKTELMRIWKNWQLMSDEMKQKSDAKCKELFKCTNKELYDYLLPQYKVDKPGKDEIKYQSNKELSEEALAEKAIKDGYLYHGSPNYYKVLKPQTQEDVDGKKALSLSPYKFVASMFCTYPEEIMKGYRRCRVRYAEWFDKPKDKYKPLSVLHIYHNIKQVGNFEKIYNGYIYTVDAKQALENASDNPKWKGTEEVLSYLLLKYRRILLREYL